MAALTRAAREAKTFAAVRQRFLAHLGDNADAEQVVMADRAARLFVKVLALEAESERRVLAAEEMDTLLQAKRILHVLTRRLGIAHAPRREQ
jgi:hypothetical protein